jgi:fatty-acyl-CoA synthase
MPHRFTFSELIFSLAQEFPNDPAFIEDDRIVPWSEFSHNVSTFADYLKEHDLGSRIPRSQLQNHESGQDHIAICMQNSVNYMAVYLGSCVARTAPLNINYKYTAEELRFVLVDSAAKVLVYDSQFAEVVAEATKGLPDSILLVENTPSGEALQLGNAIPLSSCYKKTPSAPESFVTDSSPEDFVLLYTGGTTGMPKGVMWTQEDLFVQALGGRNYRDGGREWNSIDEFLESVRKRRAQRLMPACPFMHGTGLWTALQTLFGGGTVILPKPVLSFQAPDALDAISRHEVVSIVIVGDAFVRSITQELKTTPRSLPHLKFIISSGAAISESNKELLAELLPHVVLKNIVGSSESGPQAEESETEEFIPRPGAVILAEDKSKIIDSSVEQIGWLATSGHIPLGYLNDAKKTSSTFPVVEGVRYSIPGDRVVSLGDGRFRFMGRDSLMINTGGEKVFVEEVEEALKAHPAVHDVLVVGRPSERWGQEVVAIVSFKVSPASDDELLAAASVKIARYKLPKAIIAVDTVQRSPAGKGDYRWAQSVASSAT